MQIKIALAGNPNSGKTTLFNALTGANQFVGNWPGVTVEKKEGKLKKHNDVVIMDLPGIYSLSPYTLEEVVARNYLIQERPDVIQNIIDGTNLERNLYLTMVWRSSTAASWPPTPVCRGSWCWWSSWRSSQWACSGCGGSRACGCHGAS